MINFLQNICCLYFKIKSVYAFYEYYISFYFVVIYFAVPSCTESNLFLFSSMTLLFIVLFYVYKTCTFVVLFLIILNIVPFSHFRIDLTFTLIIYADKLVHNVLKKESCQNWSVMFNIFSNEIYKYNWIHKLWVNTCRF